MFKLPGRISLKIHIVWDIPMSSPRIKTPNVRKSTVSEIENKKKGTYIVKWPKYDTHAFCSLLEHTL